jgi:hypothetical protein
VHIDLKNLPPKVCRVLRHRGPGTAQGRIADDDVKPIGVSSQKRAEAGCIFQAPQVDWDCLGVAAQAYDLLSSRLEGGVVPGQQEALHAVGRKGFGDRESQPATCPGD